jgi:hypothetical protein
MYYVWNQKKRYCIKILENVKEICLCIYEKYVSLSHHAFPFNFIMYSIIFNNLYVLSFYILYFSIFNYN